MATVTKVTKIPQVPHHVVPNTPVPSTPVLSTPVPQATTTTSSVATTASPTVPSPVIKPSNVPRTGPGLSIQLLTAGTAACIADCITFPLDTVKVRLQVKNNLVVLKIILNLRYTMLLLAK